MKIKLCSDYGPKKEWDINSFFNIYLSCLHMHTNFPINALIVDDEKKACTNLKNMLTEYVPDGLNIAGMAHNTRDAEKQIGDVNPDVVFLDIEMPNENAFHFLDRIAPINFEVIFVTSYNEYAIKAFRLNAVDYILKPISISELVSAVEKLKDRIRFKKTLPQYTPAAYTQISEEVNNRNAAHKIILKSTNSTEVVDFKHIFFIEAQSSYSKFVFTKGTAIREVVMSNPLSDYEELLPTDIFYRIHRSYLVNCGLIKKIWKNGSNRLQLQDNIILPVSRRRFPLLLDFLKQNHHYDE